MSPLKIAVVGGECTGKTILCQTLATRMPGLWVPEYLREFVDRLGRVPAGADQPSILASQVEREVAATDRAAQVALRWVACDSAPIATAIYSEMYFGDRSLYALAERHHASYALTLLMDTDLAWEADGLQRDGPGVRAEFHSRIAVWLQTHDAPFLLVGGAGDSRAAAAIAALRGLESLSR